MFTGTETSPRSPSYATRQPSVRHGIPTWISSGVGGETNNVRTASFQFMSIVVVCCVIDRT